MAKKCGIYIIKSPTGKLYVGQTRDIDQRIRAYRNLNCINQFKIFNSIKKYGWDAHVFEVLCYCNIEDLDKKEIFYIKKYKTFNTKHGMNLKSGGNTPKYSAESVEKRVSKLRGRKRSPEYCLRVSEWMKGRKPSQETLLKRSIALKGKKQSKEHIEKRVATRKLKGNYRDNSANLIKYIKDNGGGWNKGKVCPQLSESKSGGKNPNARKVMDTKTGIIFETIKDASVYSGIKRITLWQYLSGARKNKTQMIFYNEDLCQEIS